MIIFLLLYGLMLLYFIIEYISNKRCLSSFHAVIHVNGIRGKTSTSRYIDAALRKRYKVFTKTTGTDAMMIHVDGKETPVRRLGPANIHEQLRIIRRAKKEGAEILILECMAVNPALQKIAQEQIVKSNITVITNVRYDHIFEMGESLDEIAESLASTVPENGILFTADAAFVPYFEEKCKEKNSRLIFCPSGEVAEENTSIAREISRFLHVPEEDFKESLNEVKEDFGIRQIYPAVNKNGQEFYFLSLFSANDPQSTINNINNVRERYKGLYFLYNHREDRPDRALLFARYFIPLYKESQIFLLGKGASLPKRLFSQAGASRLDAVRSYKECFDLPAGSLLVGIGNIKGAGYELIKSLEQGGDFYE